MNSISKEVKGVRNSIRVSHGNLKREKKYVNKAMGTEEFARLCGLSNSMIQGIESGRVTPSIGTLEKIAKATGRVLIVTFVEK